MNRQAFLGYVQENFDVDGATIRLIDNILVFVALNFSSRAAQCSALYDLLDNTIGLKDSEIEVDLTESPKDLLLNLCRDLFLYANNFDVSYETYLWLDNDGHGKNGAPYDMLDVYRGMEECQCAVEDLARSLYKIYKEEFE